MNREERTNGRDNDRSKEWNSTTGMMDETGERINTYTVAKSLTLDNFTKLFDEFLNLGR